MINGFGIRGKNTGQLRSKLDLLLNTWGWNSTLRQTKELLIDAKGTKVILFQLKTISWILLYLPTSSIP